MGTDYFRQVKYLVPPCNFGKYEQLFPNPQDLSPMMRGINTVNELLKE